MPYKDSEKQKASQRKHYEANKDKFAERVKAKKAELRLFLHAVKSYPCLDCGECYPFYVMQFDHKPGIEKLYTPARLSLNCSWAKTITEIMKCEEVCANCHAVRTHLRRNAS